MQITLDLKVIDTEALTKLGYAIYHDAAERNQPLTQAKAIVNEIESRELDRCWTKRITEELREMIGSTETKRAKESRKDKDGNVWAWTYNRAGEQVRVCIPGRE